MLSLCCCSSFSLVVERGSYSLVIWAFHCGDSSCCGTQALGHVGSVAVAPASRAQAHYWVAPRHVGSSWIREPARVSCIGRWVLYHWATREALHWLFFFPLHWLLFTKALSWITWTCEKMSFCISDSILILYSNCLFLSRLNLFTNKI